MPPRLIRYQLTIDFDRHGTNIGAFLDMLRYDGARVLNWTTVPSDRERTYRITLEAPRPEYARWHSFGLYPQEV